MSLSAAITAAAPKQRHLLHQTLAKEDAQLETIAQFAIQLLMPTDREPLVDRIAIIIPKGDRERFPEHRNITLIEQEPP